MNLVLKRVRLSFPAVHRPKAFSDDQEAKYSAVLLLDKKRDAAQIKAIKDGIDGLLAEKAKGIKLKADKVCLKDGSLKEDLDGYGPDVMFLSASNLKKIPVVDRDLTPLDEDSGKPYAGCYVDCSIQLWYQDNRWGERVNAQLRAIKFVDDGEAFGDKADDPNEVFEPEDDSVKKDEESML